MDLDGSRNCFDPDNNPTNFSNSYGNYQGKDGRCFESSVSNNNAMV